METKVTLEALIEVENVLKELGVPHFLVGSMVLAVYRDKDFLPGTQDLDIGVLNEYKYFHGAIRDRLKELGWTVWQEADITGTRLDMEKNVGEIHLSLNIHYFKKFENFRWSSIFKTCQLYDADIFEQVSWHEFKGLQVPLPGKPEKYLEAEYGHWKTPRTLSVQKEKTVMSFYPSLQRARDFDLWNKIKERMGLGKIGYAFIVGDLFHIGHLRFLEKCKEHCNFLIVGVYNDELTTSYKREPIIPFKERIEIVKALKCVDLVVEVGPQDTPGGLDITPILMKLIAERYDIKVIFHGDDWKDVTGREYIEKWGGQLILIPYYEGQSTTAIIERIKKIEKWKKNE